ncbi:Augmenter of liver regeneration [Carabus blaptoides fortunei]
MPSLHNPDDTPCRSCSSFSEYMKQSKKKYNAAKEISKQNESKDIEIIREDCPLDKDQLGRSTWGFLHTMAARYPKKPNVQEKNDMTQFIHLFSKFYPCDICAADFREDLKTTPPKIDSQDSLSQWLCTMHNKVNIKLGKPEFDCSKVNERWRDGWLDGSCG